MNLNRRILIAAMPAFSWSGAYAQAFPSRPIKLIVAFPPGGPADTMGRIVAEALGTMSGMRIVVDNHAGANGTIGVNLVAKSAPDGYTVLLTSLGAMAISPHLQRDLSFKPLVDFTPITQLVNQPPVYAVGSNVPADNIRELVDMAKKNVGKYSFATTGTGSTAHISLDIFKAKTGADIAHIPYKGAAPAVNDVLGGQVTGIVADIPVLLPHIRAGKLKALAMAAPTRSALLPNVPTLAESGITDAEAVNWLGLLTPAKTPTHIVRALYDATIKALASPAVQERIASLGAIPAASASSEEFRKFIFRENERWGRRIRDNGIKAE